MEKSSAVASAETYTVDRARDILSHPEQFVQICETIFGKRNETMLFQTSEDMAHQLLDLVRDDQIFLRQVYTLYNTDNPVAGFVASNAIERMESDDDAYFKQVFEGSRGYHIKTAALRKINDLPYVKTVITEKAKTDEGCASPASDFLLVRGDELYETDSQFVDALAESATDQYIRSGAINATSNLTILQKYAYLSEKDSNQLRHELKSEEAHRAYLNGIYKATAIERIALLAK